MTDAVYLALFFVGGFILGFVASFVAAVLSDIRAVRREMAEKQGPLPLSNPTTSRMAPRTFFDTAERIDR